MRLGKAPEADFDFMAKGVDVGGLNAEKRCRVLCTGGLHASINGSCSSIR